MIKLREGKEISWNDDEGKPRTAAWSVILPSGVLLE